MSSSGEDLGRTLGTRVYVLGHLRIDGPDGTVGTGDLPGRQGRVAIAYLALERERPVPRDELADAIWGSEPPPSQDNALSSIVSKLRAALSGAGLDGPASLVSEARCYRLVLPTGTWFDVETAMNRVDAAEGALRDGERRPEG
jgi:SARP family transcriptional regulator, regulator of embCAB operon